ncbi:MAG: glycoside hydrolase family 3 C-terminal domain-containing protein [Myxococcota bacterium]|jgi:beta-glucosidase|nr:glycoside hydrolase family 3 C-terminal domain-containing protein [Myxococcota bacterium]
MSERTRKLLAELDLEEKVGLMSGRDMWTNHPVERLGIAALRVSDGPNGARGRHFEGFTTAACFPCGAALGATFDPDLVEEVGAALGRETASKAARLLLAPTINIHRSPLAGRNFECYSEDPHLSGRIAVAFVKGVQSKGVGATLKHFVCNDSEFERHTISSQVDERTLREIYLVPFEAAVKEASPWSIMTGYNRLDGTYCAEHTRLLDEILREEWGFDGFVISDWFGTQSTAASASAGLDLEMPGPVRHYGEKLMAAVNAGEVSRDTIDARARRMLEVHERAGLLDGEVDDVERANDLPEDRALARRAAASAMVLLCNAGELLPLDPSKLSRLAVIGPNASLAVMQGGGSARVAPHRRVTPLDGIRAALGGEGAGRVEVVHERGCANHRGTHPVLDTSFLEPGPDFATPELTTEVFANADLEGSAVYREARRNAECVWVDGFCPDVDFLTFSARMRGHFVAPETGDYRFSLKSFGRSRLLVDGELVLDQWTDPTPGEAFYGRGTDIAEGFVSMQAGKRYEVVAEYSAPGEDGMVGFNVGCLLPDPADAMDRAVDAARSADCAVVVVGLNADWETEGSDRVDMELPGRQVELIDRVSEANSNTVVVVNAGSPLAMEFADRVPAILQLWYPGQEMGHALADVLFGEASPGGRLPTTFPMSYSDHPAFAHYPGQDGRVDYGEGLMVGYRHYDTRGGEPRFVFGHGLSYSTFEYGEVRLAKSSFARGEDIAFDVEVRNTGHRRSNDVAQIYVHDFESRLPRPEQELVAFQKFELDPGETTTLHFALGERALAFYDPALPGWEAEPGRFEVRVGASSRDIRSSASFDLTA